MKPNIITKIKWYQMMNIKDCTKNPICKCANELRKAIVAIPINKYDEKRIDFITSDEDATLATNQITVAITYDILPANARDELKITSTMTS